MGCLKWILTSLRAWSLSLGALFTLWVIPGVSAPSWTPATSFYRTQNALFPSGQIGRQTLEKNLLRQEQELSFHLQWNGKTAVIPFEDGLIDLFLISSATLKENLNLLAEPNSGAKSVASLSRGTEVEVLQYRGHWFQVKSGTRRGWVLWNRLNPKNDDLGIFMPVVDTFLRQKAEEGSPILTTLGRGSRLKALEYLDNGWIRIKTSQHEGFAQLQYLAGRADFAAWAWEKGKGWFLVSHRQGSLLKSRDGREIPLASILGYSPLEHRVIVTRTENPRELPLRAHAEILRLNVTLWGVSDLPGHGEVWWKKDLFHLDDPESDAETLTTEQLLSRPLFSYALEDKKQIRGLASSGGIWKTTDGKVWKKIRIFGDQDLPVAIHPKGIWFVGTHRSFDEGRTFENSIRWDELTKTIEQKIRKTPGRITLKKLDLLPTSEVQLQIETGGRRVSVRSRIDQTSWY